MDTLEDKTHLPAILQSLGCIAQTALPIFETREDEIIEFIMSKILHDSNVWLSDPNKFCIVLFAIVSNIGQ